MHLHWLKIKNIASLFGDHTIDFDQLTSQDLFAITGETGAGKSSILNAISLALYGNVYKKQLNQSDLVSLGEREASVEIQFSTKARRYQASWTARVKKKDGTLLIPPKITRFFYEVKGVELQLLDGKLKPEDVLSLDFEQFCKCVILNQGDFAKFLVSNFSERRDILEKLYPSDNLELVGGLAKRKWMECLEDLGRLQIQAHTLEGEAVFDINTIKEKRVLLLGQIEGIQERLRVLRPGIQIFETLKEQSQKFLSTQQKKADAEKIQVERTTQFNELLNKVNIFKDNLDQFQASFEKHFEQLSLDEKNYHALLRDKTRIDQTTQQLSQMSQKLERDRLKLVQLSGEIKKLQAQLSATKLHHPSFQDYSSVQWKLVDRVLYELPRLREDKKNHESELSLLTQKGKELSKSVEELKLQKSQIPGGEQNSKDRSSLIDQLKEKKSRQQSTQERRQELQTRIEKLLGEIPVQRQRLDELTLLKEGQHLQHLLASMREHLKHHPQDDCPLCAQTLPELFKATLHTSASQVQSTDYNQLFIQQEKKVTQLETQREGVEQELKALPPTDSGLDEELMHRQTHHTNLLEIEKQLEILEAQLKEARESFRLKKDKTDRLNSEVQPLEEYYHSLEQSLEGLVLNKGLFVILEQLKADLELHKLKKEKEQTLHTFTQQEVQLQHEISEESQGLTQKREIHEAEELTFKQNWKTFETNYPSGDSPEARLRKLRDEQKKMQHQEQLLQGDLRQKERDLSEARSQTQRIVDQLRQIELIFTQELHKLAQGLDMDIQIAEACTILDPFIEERKIQIQELETSLQHITTQVGFLNRQIEDDKERSQKLALLKSSLKKAEQENVRWKRVLEVLGQDDMRTFVLSLVELALIKQTNFELSKLIHGRYEILQNQKKGKLTPEFLVIDHWSDGLVRKVSTLSGGETFMVSLAMALALAEMARGRADIDSFFIDEGFGTLDEGSLEDVVEMLQQVRSRGKQIGLITHVKNLSERLPVNLRVVKNDRGHSHTQVLYN